jgi:hypothetical protein
MGENIGAAGMTTNYQTQTNENNQLAAFVPAQFFHSRHIMKRIRGARGGTI